MGEVTLHAIGHDPAVHVKPLHRYSLRPIRQLPDMLQQLLERYVLLTVEV